MSNVADINEILRRDDEEPYELINQWEAATHRYLVVTEGRAELADQIAALEGRIVWCTPRTFLVLVKVLKMAHKIMSDRDANPDCYTGDGPVAMLIARAIGAIDREDGLICRTDTG